jgi:type IV pilus assembly protein PilB
MARNDPNDPFAGLFSRPSDPPAGGVKQATKPALKQQTQPAVRAPATGIEERLVRSQMVSAAQLAEARDAAQREGGTTTGALAKLGHLEQTQLVDFLSRQYGVPAVDLTQHQISEEVVNLIPKEVAARHSVVPIQREGSTLTIAMSDPSNIYAMDDIKFLTGFNIEVVVTSETQIEDALERYYADVMQREEAKVSDLLEGFTDEVVQTLVKEDEDFDALASETEAKEAPVVRLVNLVLVDAIKRGASDIHIEPYEKEFRIRYRIDGLLYEVMRPPMRMRNAITSRAKIMAELDIAERRLPQDGRIKLVLGDRKEVDFRVNVLPCLFGEKTVMRILDRSNLQLDMTRLGFEQAQLDVFQEAIHLPFGMVLVTGPTGSGKTTTLYSALSELNKITDNICTAEDPVEFNLAGINQCQMHDSIGLNFATALRAFLRQDPDIIMVGEIRDFETAEIGIKAALTGHLVLSTLHTNDAPSTVNRLLNMGVEPFLVISSLNAIVAQRLARKVCNECKEPVELDENQLIKMGARPEDLALGQPMKGRGCKMCSDTGSKGRIALYEVMKIGDEIKECILQGYSAAELKREAMKLGMQTLRQSGIRKIMEGVTSVEEILRVTRADK